MTRAVVLLLPLLTLACSSGGPAPGAGAPHSDAAPGDPSAAPPPGDGSAGVPTASGTPPVGAPAVRPPADLGPHRCQLVASPHGRPGAVAVRAETLLTGLEVPWGIAFLPGGEWLLTERPGRVRLVRGGVLQPEPVARVPVSADQESGLLGIAVHPRFTENGFFYLYVTVDTPAGTVNRIERWVLAPDHRSARQDRVIVDGIPAGRYHDGGRLRFGPDGMLYAGTGDGKDPDRAQDLDSLSGKVLRVGPDGEAPPDNPLPGKLPYVWGVRNVQAFDWRADGALAIADHGPSGELGGRRGHDEVTLAVPGANLGWPSILGCDAAPGLVAPAISFVQAMPPGGASFYTGSLIPEWSGSLLVAALRASQVHRFTFDAAGNVLDHDTYLDGEFGRLRDLVVAPDGSVYVTTSNCDARGTCPPEKDRVIRIAR